LGAEILSRARDVVQQTEAMCDLAASERPPLTGALRLGVIPTIAPYLLPGILPVIREAYPKLKLYLLEGQSAHVVDELRKGNLDLVLLAFPYPLEGLQTRILFSDPFRLAVPGNHVFQKAPVVNSADLANEKLLLLEEGHCLRDQALSVCHLEAASDNTEYQATSLHTLVQMVANNLGVTFLPQMAIESGLSEVANIAIKPLENDDMARQIGFAWRGASPRLDEFQLFMDFFIKTID